MANRWNTGVRNSAVDAIGTALDNGVLEIRTGTQPASAGDAASGTLLVSITLPADAFAAASSGTAAKSGIWSATASATGTPGWFRLRNSGDTIRVDGAVGSELTLSGLTGGDIINGSTVTIDTYSLSIPAT